jgi:hypothetical protein
MLSEDSTASRESAGDDGTEGVGGTAGGVTGAGRSADAGSDACGDAGCDAGGDACTDAGGEAGDAAGGEAGADACTVAVGDAAASWRQAVENRETTAISAVDTTRLERCINPMTLAPRPARSMEELCTMCTPQ